ncbi:MAG TPA: hypothetical protein VGC76_16650 [Pyrinomonadaceae bacterium]|jgi:hypothetical protein
MRKIFLWLFCGLALATAAGAQKPFAVEDFAAHPVAEADDNYIDLIEQIFPESVYDEANKLLTVSKSVSLRKLSGENGDTLYEAPLDVTSATGRWFKANGEKHLALLVDADRHTSESGASLYSQTVLAVFRYVERNEKYSDGDKTKIRFVREFRLIEAADPQTDRFVSFPDDLPLIEESPANQFFWILNHHFNAGENFRSYETIRVGANKRLSLAIEKMVGAYDSDDCSDNRLDSFWVEQHKRQPKNSLPYDFRLRTLIWTKNECERRLEWTNPIEEMRIYQARQTTSAKSKRRVLRLVLVKLTRKKIRFYRDRGYIKKDY